MMHLFQCLLVCRLDAPGTSNVLLAASRSRIFVFSLSSGNLITTWQSSQKPAAASSKVEKTLPEYHGPERPAKRLKKCTPNEGSDTSSTEIVTGDAQTKPIKSSKPQTGNANVIKLIGTSDGRHVVAVTDEDKCVRVLHLDLHGRLQQLSDRSMPKRPCAIAFTPDEATIICGDKFGDVYALPLFCSDGNKERLSHIEADKAGQKSHAAEDRFVPSATLRTVHTQRNQESLKHQQNQKSKKSVKNAISFERELLFGHVSLLTDLICLPVPRSTTTNLQDRTYIISADRDEHIRVSRGMPQAHVIEGFCLGHTQFISRLCIPHWNPQLLISGGGDDYLLIWDWLSSRILHKVDLRKLIVDYFEYQYSVRSDQEQEPTVAIEGVHWNGPIAVSDIFAFEVKTVSGGLRKQIALACEGVRGIFFFDFSEDGRMIHAGTTTTAAAITALSLSSDHNCIAYAISSSEGITSQLDSVGKGESPKGTSIGILEYDTMKGSWEKNDSLMNTINNALGSIPTDMDEQGRLYGTESFLHSLETLRKRGQDENHLT